MEATIPDLLSPEKTLQTLLEEPKVPSGQRGQVLQQVLGLPLQGLPTMGPETSTLIRCWNHLRDSFQCGGATTLLHPPGRQAHPV